jgi:hypothetical protein
MNTIRRFLTLAVGVALALMLGACAGPGGCAANPAGPGCQPSPSPPPSPRITVVLDSASYALPAFFVSLQNLTTTEAGSFDITVDWTFATNDVDVALTRGECSFEQLIADQCVFVDMTSSTTRKPEQLRIPDQPPGRYTLLIANFGPDDESIAYQVLFTPGPRSASAARAMVLSGHRDKFLRLRGATHR